MECRDALNKCKAHEIYFRLAANVPLQPNPAGPLSLFNLAWREIVLFINLGVMLIFFFGKHKFWQEACQFVEGVDVPSLYDYYTLISTLKTDKQPRSTRVLLTHTIRSETQTHQHSHIRTHNLIGLDSLIWTFTVFVSDCCQSWGAGKNKHMK